MRCSFEIADEEDELAARQQSQGRRLGWGIAYRSRRVLLAHRRLCRLSNAGPQGSALLRLGPVAPIASPSACWLSTSLATLRTALRSQLEQPLPRPILLRDTDPATVSPNTVAYRYWRKDLLSSSGY
jgi:hypothetical protein